MEKASWEENGTFKECLRLSEGRPEFTFYDGPPFATGLPHYGHILAGDVRVPTRWTNRPLRVTFCVSPDGSFYFGFPVKKLRVRYARRYVVPTLSCGVALLFFFVADAINVCRIYFFIL